MFVEKYRTRGLGDNGNDLLFRAVQHGDIVAECIFRTDDSIQKLINDPTRHDESSVSDFIAKTNESYEIASYDHTGNLVDYYQLITKQWLLEDIVAARLSFGTDAGHEIRRQVVDGFYGLIGELLESALGDLSEHLGVGHETEKAELTGVINELTALALLNRRQIPEVVALPSFFVAERYNSSDIDLLIYQKDDNGIRVFRQYPIQVKSSPRERTADEVPESVVLISAKDMDNLFENNVSFPTARRILEELNGTISDEDLAKLNQTCSKLYSHVDQEMDRLKHQM